MDTFIFFVAQFKYGRFSKWVFFKLHTYSRLDGATSLEVRRNLRKQEFFLEDGRASSYLAGPLFLFHSKIRFVIQKGGFLTPVWISDLITPKRIRSDIEVYRGDNGLIILRRLTRNIRIITQEEGPCERCAKENVLCMASVQKTNPLFRTSRVKIFLNVCF